MCCIYGHIILCITMVVVMINCIMKAHIILFHETNGDSDMPEIMKIINLKLIFPLLFLTVAMKLSVWVHKVNP